MVPSETMKTLLEGQLWVLPNGWAETAPSLTPTEKVTIIFADCGHLGEILLHDIVPDPRLPLDIFDVPR